MGECQILPHLFWDMTMAELDFVWYGYRHKEEQDWIKLRWQTTLLLNVQGAKVTPKELIELDCDIRNWKKEEVMTQEELQKVLNIYENAKPIK
jgi:hypothetical protein